MEKEMKKRIFEIIEQGPTKNLPSEIFSTFIIILISLNVIAVILETVESIWSRYASIFNIFEIFSVAIFTIEYILRLWVCTIDKKFDSPIIGRIKFAITPLAIIDLIVIIPFYLPMIISIDLRFMRAMRFFRFLKMGRYSESLKVLGNVIRIKKDELIMAVFTMLILLIISSSLVYYAENAAQPQSFSSIPASMWWGVSALTTVGYGDIYPITPIGKFLGAIISMLGIGMFALPAGILGSGFIEEIQKRKEKGKICRHCGKCMDD